MEKIYDVAGIGSALLDFIVEVPDELLRDAGLTKGTMTLIDKEESGRIFELISERDLLVSPGGSAANTLAGVSALGGKSVFMGKIGDDEHGDSYQQKNEAAGVVSILSRHSDIATGHAITLVTPDGERTFATHLGASLHFRKNDIRESDIAASKIIHFEGYQLDDPELRAAVIHAMDIAHASGTHVSIDLSDPGVITRNFELVMQLLREHVDMVFVNEGEAEALTGRSAEESVAIIAALCDMAVVKVGGDGSYLKKGSTLHRIAAFPVEVENTNGAGDMYAAGILYALTRDIPLEIAGKIASFAASRVVAQREARLGGSSAAEVREFILHALT